MKTTPLDPLRTTMTEPKKEVQVVYKAQTVGELRAMLAEYPDETPVLHQWDSGTCGPIYLEEGFLHTYAYPYGDKVGLMDRWCATDTGLSEDPYDGDIRRYTPSAPSVKALVIRV